MKANFKKTDLNDGKSKYVTIYKKKNIVKYSTVTLGNPVNCKIIYKGHSELALKPTKVVFMLISFFYN